VQKLLANAVKCCITLAMLLFLGASPAAAHGSAGSPASNYHTVILTGTAGGENGTGFSVRAIEDGNRMEVRWLAGPVVLVPGYDDEPYLRIGPKGVEENRRSAAAYVNDDRQGTTSPPDSVDPDAAPVWKRISTVPVARFHDHRAHYMGSLLPEQVAAEPGKRHRFNEFEIPIAQGASVTEVTGYVEWIPSPRAVAQYVGAVALAVGVIGLAAWAGIDAHRRKKIRIPIVALFVCLIAVDKVHLYGIVLGVEGGSWLGRLVSIGYASIAAWVIGIVAAVLWLRGRQDAMYVITFAAALMALIGGVADLSILTKSSIVFRWSDAVARWSVAATLGLGIGLVIAGVLLTRPQTVAESA
jgi:hypothetical protein